jgi:alpha-beta hydrolase superfamily lysophospholipase
MKKVFVGSFIGLLLASLISWMVAGRLVSPVRGEVMLPENNLPVVSFKIESQSKSVLSGWHIDARSKKGVVVLFHGIRATKLSMFKRAQLLYKHGFSVVLIDFQSHGESTGDRITMGYLEKHDVLASIDYATSHHLGEPVGVIGVSLGGASTLLASPQDIDALVIESVYPDISRAVHNRVKAKLGFLSWVPAEILLAQLEPRLGFSISKLSPIEKIGSLKYPIFVISGSDDVHTTVEETRQMYRRANEPKKLWLAKGVAHKDIYSEMPMLYEDKVIGFLAYHMKNSTEKDKKRIISKVLLGTAKEDTHF